jgi:hypothetical protein
MANRASHYSTMSGAYQPRTNTMQGSTQVSTTTLLNALHNSFATGQPYPLESSTSLVVNTWLSASQTGNDGRVGGTVDVELARRSWEHARRRAEDSAIVLGYEQHYTVAVGLDTSLTASQLTTSLYTFSFRTFHLSLATVRPRLILHSTQCPEALPSYRHTFQPFFRTTFSTCCDFCS